MSRTEPFDVVMSSGQARRRMGDVRAWLNARKPKVESRYAARKRQEREAREAKRALRKSEDGI